ncbi:MAG TPA: hypothetical protein VFX18_03285 [Candidatus Nitrosocosmicus sp.]|nr:hypothetical protein [Candidatus Nitrosocosmicus sp.]
MSDFIEIESKDYNELEDAIDPDLGPVLCDTCPGGIKLVLYKTSLVCPQCQTMTDPKWETVQHQTMESTIEEDLEFRTGELSFIEKSDDKPQKTQARKNIDEDELPEYVKDEIEAIKWRPGYTTVPVDKTIFYNSRSTKK